MIYCPLCGDPVQWVRSLVNARGGWTHRAPCGHDLDLATVREAYDAGLIGRLPEVTAAMLVAAERRRQVEEEGYTAQRDAALGADLAWMVWAIIDRVIHDRLDDETRPRMWPENRPWRPGKSPVRALVIAAALICAEIDRRLRKGETP